MLAGTKRSKFSYLIKNELCRFLRPNKFNDISVGVLVKAAIFRGNSTLTLPLMIHVIISTKSVVQGSINRTIIYANFIL